MIIVLQFSAVLVEVKLYSVTVPNAHPLEKQEVPQTLNCVFDWLDLIEIHVVVDAPNQEEVPIEKLINLIIRLAARTLVSIASVEKKFYESGF